MSFDYNLIDLTHTLSSRTPSWNGGCGYFCDVKLDYHQCDGPVQFRVQQLKMHAGIGTHMDVPAHCVPNGKTAEQMILQDLIGPGCMIDVSSQTHERYSVSVQDIHDFEEINGRIPDGAFVLIRTGWDQYWEDEDRYRNNYIFPSVSKEAIDILMKRHIIGLGIDTLSPDRPEDGFPVHDALLRSGKFIIENVAHSDLLPPTGFHLLSCPMKAEGATETPVRLVGFIHTMKS